MYFSPDGRSAALFGFENAIEMTARREATFCRNDIVAVVGTFCHHLLGCIESYLAEPYSKVRVQALVEELTQFVLGYTKRTGKRQHVYITVLIS